MKEKVSNLIEGESKYLPIDEEIRECLVTLFDKEELPLTDEKAKVLMGLRKTIQEYIFDTKDMKRVAYGYAITGKIYYYLKEDNEVVVPLSAQELNVAQILNVFEQDPLIFYKLIQEQKILTLLEKINKKLENAQLSKIT